MKKLINLSAVITVLTLILLAGCNSEDKTTQPEITTTEMPVVMDTMQNVMSDTTSITKADTANKAAVTQTNPSTKIKKGKVSTVMMVNNTKNTTMNTDKEGYYSSVEVLPMFPGGQRALDNFILENLEYPQDANDNGIEGRVTVNFAVDETGKIYNPKIVGKKMGYGLEEEVLKAVTKMPAWTPGIIKGKPVKTYYSLPVNFKLDN